MLNRKYFTNGIVIKWKIFIFRLSIIFYLKTLFLPTIIITIMII